MFEKNLAMALAENLGLVIHARFIEVVTPTGIEIEYVAEVYFE